MLETAVPPSLTSGGCQGGEWGEARQGVWGVLPLPHSCKKSHSSGGSIRKWRRMMEGWHVFLYLSLSLLSSSYRQRAPSDVLSLSLPPLQPPHKAWQESTLRNIWEGLSIITYFHEGLCRHTPDVRRWLSSLPSLRPKSPWTRAPPGLEAHWEGYSNWPQGSSSFSFDR